MMRFNKISFENYRCFLNGFIEFKKAPNKNMTVLIAPNGGGKTETLFAFWWALYDYDFSKLTNKEQTPYALNSALYRKLEQAPVGTSEHCSVTVEFEEEGTDYVVKKYCEYRKTEKQVRCEEYRELSYYYDNGELSLPLRDNEKIIKKLSRIIPKKILYGIIFDGERMQKLNTPDESSVNAIRAVINDITNVELIEKCNVNFKSIKRKLNKELKKYNNKKGNFSLEEIVDDESKKSSKKEKLEKNLENYQSDLEKVNIELENISNQLLENKEVQEIEKDRKAKRAEQVRLENILDTCYKNFSATLRDGYILATEALLRNVESIIKKYDVPQDLTVFAVENILKRSKCICGREMNENAIKQLKDLMKILPPDNINSTLVEVVSQTRQRIEDIKIEAKNHYDLIQNTELDIKKCKEEIALLSTRISSMDDSNEISKNAILLEKLNDEKKKEKIILEHNIEETGNKIEDLKNELKMLKDQLNNFNFNSLHEQQIKAQRDYVDKCIEALDELKNINKQKALESINENLKNAYQILSEDAERGRRIKIIHRNSDRRYQIAVYMKDEYDQVINRWKKDGSYAQKKAYGLSETEIEESAIMECIDSNSTGQSKINTFAFVKAILDYSNSIKKDDKFEIKKEYPLLIDAPFGDISAGNLSRSSAELHNFAKQVILMIDEDKYNSLREVFDPYTANKYTFEKVDGKNYSTIKSMED